MRVYGVYTFDSRMWFLPLGVLVLALLVRRSLMPLRAFFTGIGSDWTLLSLAFYCFIAWVSVLYDENHNPYLLVFIIASTLAVCAGAWFYFAQYGAIRRVLSLIAGIIALIIIGGIDNATWDWRAYYHLPPKANAISPVGVAMVALFLALTYLTGYLTQKLQQRRQQE